MTRPALRPYWRPRFCLNFLGFIFHERKKRRELTPKSEDNIAGDTTEAGMLA